MRRATTWIYLAALTVCAAPQAAFAGPVYAFAFGIPLENVVVPGSLVSIEAGLKNLGDAPIVFQSQPSQPPIPRVFAGFSLGDGEWDPITTLEWGPSRSQDLFFAQFRGVTINPGETFTFVLASFIAPNNPPGSTARPNISFGVDYSNTIGGSLLASASDHRLLFDNTAHPVYTLGTTASTSGVTFFQGLVIDSSTNEIISGPASTVPEASTTSLLLCGMTALALAARASRRNTPRDTEVDAAGLRE